VVPHVQFGRVQKPFEFEPTCVAIRYHITHLADDCGENEDSYEVTGDGENVPANINYSVISLNQLIIDCYRIYIEEGRSVPSQLFVLKELS